MMMAGIGTVDVAHMNNGAHFLFMSNVLDRAEADEAVTAKAARQVAALRAALTQEDADLKLSAKSLLSDRIAASDRSRGRYFMAYKKAVKSLADLPGVGAGEAAKALSQHVRDYAISPRMQLDRETGLLANFIADLEGKHAAQVAALSLGQLVERLKEANEQVRALTLRRTEERMGVRVGALKASRLASDKAYRRLVAMVNALAVVEGEEAYLPFVSYVNAEIAHYKREVLARKTKAPQAPDADSADNPPSPEGGEEETGGL